MIPETIESVRISGIVRHYHVPGEEEYTPYCGVLKDNDDQEFEEGKPSSLPDVLKNFPDGEHVVITIETKGKHPNADGFVWMLTKPHTYERVPIEQWKKTLKKSSKPQEVKT